MEKLKKLFEETLPEHYNSNQYQKIYGIEILDSEKPHIELKNK
jgi:hypothetical protein